MKDVTITIDHPGKLLIVAEIVADSPAYAEGLKKLHAELNGSKLDAQLSFDEIQGKLTCTVSVESDAHKAAVKAAAAVAKAFKQQLEGPIKTKFVPRAKKKATKKKPKK